MKSNANIYPQIDSLPCGYSERQLSRIKIEVNRAYREWLRRRGFKEDVGFNPIYFKSRKNEDEE